MNAQAVTRWGDRWTVVAGCRHVPAQEEADAAVMARMTFLAAVKHLTPAQRLGFLRQVPRDAGMPPVPPHGEVSLGA